ncbi:2862_t:CDS:2, partial [Racocetra persica]
MGHILTGLDIRTGELRIKELEKVKLPWVSNPKIQEKLFNLLDNDLAKLIKEKLLRNFNPLAEFNCLKIETGKLFSTISRKQADNSIFFTTIQKFNQEIKKNVPPNKFLVIVDEAHRSQHGEFAQIMRSLLPNAAFLGLTATPITKKERITSEAFGEKEYIYTSTQS